MSYRRAKITLKYTVFTSWHRYNIHTVGLWILSTDGFQSIHISLIDILVPNSSRFLTRFLTRLCTQSEQLRKESLDNFMSCLNGLRPHKQSKLPRAITPELSTYLRLLRSFSVHRVTITQKGVQRRLLGLNLVNQTRFNFV